MLNSSEQAHSTHAEIRPGNKIILDFQCVYVPSLCEGLQKKAREGTFRKNVIGQEMFVVRCFMTFISFYLN